MIKKIKSIKAFTVVEIVVVAPIVILLIGLFISSIVAMTGSVMKSRSDGSLEHSVQTALNTIEQDVKNSGGYLATNNFAITSPQGLNDDTTAFTNVDSATTGSTLILNSYTTTSNPLSSNRTIIYSTTPNACDSTQVSQNPALMSNVVYFVKQNVDQSYTLWRRILMPANYATIGCSLPWQQPSCAVGSSGAICIAKDSRLLDGVDAGGFVVQYLRDNDQSVVETDATNSAKTNTERQTLMADTSKIRVTISATVIAAGESLSFSDDIEVVSPNDNTTATGDKRVKVLAVGGGGSGSSSPWGGGGGGGGGVIYNSSMPVSTGAITVTVGNGGAASSGGGNAGGDSYFGSLRAFGGGGGNSGDGGSGGGGGHNGLTGDFGDSIQTSNNGGIGYGNRGGGNTYVSPYPNGGGGGAGGPGGDGILVDNGTGGPGMAFDISGTLTYYGGGGGASDTNSRKSAGGIGGGGGGKGNVIYTNATETTGGNEYAMVPILSTAQTYLGETVTFYADLKSAINGNVSFYALGKYRINASTSWASTTSYQRIKMVGRFAYDKNSLNGDVCNLSFYGTYGSGVIPTFRNVKIELGNVDGTNALGGGGGGGTGDNSGRGGNGVVIVSYPTGTMTATGGTITTSGGYTIHKFLTSGTFTVS